MRILLIASFILSLAACGGSDDKALLGDACEVGTDCEGLVCLQQHAWLFGSLEFPGGYCTNGECNSGNVGMDCAGEDGICLVYNPTGDFDCYLRCLADEECSREDYSCFLFYEDRTQGACVPTIVIPK